MSQIHTHYDNLKVARNAPPEIIRAAYKTLSQKFHPDRNPDKPNATRTFQIISLAYEVLSDPVRRRAHDEWIAAEEAKEAEASYAFEDSSAAAHRKSARVISYATVFQNWKTRDRGPGSHSFPMIRKDWLNYNRLVRYAFWLLLPTLILVIIVAV